MLGDRLERLASRWSNSVYIRVAMKKPRPPARSVPNTKSLRLHGTIARNIGVAILSGTYSADDHLSNEIASSKSLGVSRSAYREAIRILAAKGLVESKTRTGTRVCARANWHLLDTDILAWALETDPNSELLYYLLELRDIVDSSAAALAAERRSEVHLDTMRFAINIMRQYPLATEIGRGAERDFFLALHEATANPYVMSLAASISAAVDAASKAKQSKHAAAPDIGLGYMRVFQAIADKDPFMAKSMMSELVRLALRDNSLLHPPDQQMHRSA